MTTFEQHYPDKQAWRVLASMDRRQASEQDDPEAAPFHLLDREYDEAKNEGRL